MEPGSGENIGICRICGAPLSGDSMRCPRCADRLTPDTIPGRLSSLSGYELGKLIGAGGMAYVYLGEDRNLDRKVAIKVIAGEFAGSPQKRARFLREGRVMASIDHPHIVRVHTLGEADKLLYLVMEYVDGESLDKRIERLGRLGWKEALLVARQVIEALDAAWQKSIVHRDIKPGNILLDRESSVKVTDFGLAKSIEGHDSEGLTKDGFAVGTASYVSPEQAMGNKVDFRADMYSLGIVLYEMLVGERPFKGAHAGETLGQQLSRPLPDMREAQPDLPSGVVELVRQMTEKDLRKRPQSYAALLQRIDSLAGDGRDESEPKDAGASTAESKIRGTGRAWWIAAAILVLLVASVLALRWHQRPLTLEAVLQAERRLADGARETVNVSTQGELNGGDRLWVDSLKANRGGYVYVFLLNSAGTLEQLFPSPMDPEGEAHKIIAGRPYRLPPAGHWELDQQSGVETVFVVGIRSAVSTDRLASLVEQANEQQTKIASARRGVTYVPELRGQVDSVLRRHFQWVQAFTFVHR